MERLHTISAKIDNIPTRGRLVALILVLCALLLGTWGSVRFTTNHLLYRHATTDAHDWARYLASNVADLEQIAAGERPSDASMAFFESARRAHQVFSYKIFNPTGHSQFVSEQGRIALVDLSEYSSEAAQSAKTGLAIVDVKQSTSPNMPEFFSLAFVPVMSEGRALAVVAAYVDQAEERRAYNFTYIIAAVALCLVTGIAFIIPALAWHRRTREKQQADRDIRFLARHDSLTGAANRAQLKEKLDGALDTLSATGGGVAVLFIDCDRFKEVNDSLGHDGGDAVLATIAQRLRDIARADDALGRLGGDEFVIVQTGISRKEHAESLASRVAASVSEPIKIDGQETSVNVSIGIAIAPQDGDTAERLLKCADLALYKSKADGRNCIRFFKPEMDAALQTKLEIERMVRAAVIEERFTLHYQPLFNIADNWLVGFEALVRLRLPDGSLIPPTVFIPVAEEIRFIDKIGTWVLREACHTATTWSSNITIAVNLSPAQFAAGSVSNIVKAALDEATLAPRRLEIEITESLLLSNSESVMAELWKLKNIGVAIVMDDFGTGYSSLGYLLQFPFDKLKIDRSFMHDFGDSGSRARTVVKAIIALGRELQLRVTVEGVETAEQVAFLRSSGGDQAQGFYYGRPVPSAEASEIIMTDQRKNSGDSELQVAGLRAGRVSALRSGTAALSAPRSRS